jgi:hypothetical protein
MPKLAHINFADYPLSLPDCNEIEEMILRRDEAGLQNTLDNGTHTHLKNSIGLLKLATSIGWVRGCEILFEQLPRPWRASYQRTSLLRLALRSDDIRTLDFWLCARARATGDDLRWIGTTLEAVADLRFSPNHYTLAWASILDTIVRERRQLQALTEAHGVQGHCNGRQDRLPDAHTRCAISRLLVAGVPVNDSLRSESNGVYFFYSPFIPLEMMDQLYDAGFQDILATEYMCSGFKSISPLLHFATTSCHVWESGSFIQRFCWFLSKGADALECWPGSTITALHCAGWQLGDFLRYRKDISCEAPSMVELLVRKDTDGCDCPCNIGGCLFIICAAKSVKWNQEHVHYSGMFGRLTYWVDLATAAPENRWLVKSFIRSYVFESLGIRHTCCDIERILHEDNPDLDKSPTPRYSPTILRRIQKEDAFLVDLLEELVPVYDAEYDSFDGGLEAFVTDYMDLDLEKRLGEIRSQDEEQYGEGRRELGVVMEVESDDEVEEDPISDEELEELSEDEI